MKKKTPVSRHSLTLLQGALVGAFSMVPASGAWATNFWVGPGDVTEGASWSVGSVTDPAGGANVINSSSPAAPWNATTFTSGLNLQDLYVGHGSGASGAFNITPDGSASNLYMSVNQASDPALPPLAATDPYLRVGDAGGTGTLTVDMTTPLTVPPGSARVTTWGPGLGVGLGAGSTGQVNVLGAGKSADQLGYAAPNSMVVRPSNSNSLVGQAGGNGLVNINGASLHLETGTANQYSTPTTYFAVGEGAGSTGAVNVLGSGKLSSSNPNWVDNSQSGPKLPYNFIGKSGGTGVVTVQPTTGGFPNQADFYSGLSVGTTGGNGALDVLAGGKSLVSNGMAYPGAPGTCSATQPSSYPPAPASLQISADGASTGLVRATGSATELLVTGKMNNMGSLPVLLQDHVIGRVQIGTGGTLVTADTGTVKVGANLLQMATSSTGSPVFVNTTVGGLGPVNVSGSGSVVYGSETATATAPGTIEASQINLADATSQLRFNHTSSINFNLPLVGSGTVVQQAGTTTISPTLAGLPALDPNLWQFDTTAACMPAVASSYPTDQSAFAGSLAVQGGTLVLPTTNILPSLTAISITGGTLMQGGTSQNLGAVTQSGGVLQLTGGSTPGATDTANATAWSGSGGTVQLDTVLGTDGSPSDKLRITGPISGTTVLQISNLGGAGAATTGNGILVVDAASASGSGTFTLAGGTLVQGGFVYSLVKAADGNWYLQSTPVPPPSGVITIQQTVSTAAGAAPYSGSIPFTLNCTTPSYQFSGTITVTNNTGTAAPITVAAGSVCTVSQGALPGVTGFTWGAPVYVQPSGAMPGAGSQTITISNTLTQNGGGTGPGGTGNGNGNGNGNGTGTATPVPTLGEGGLAALAALMLAAMAGMRRRVLR
ncbi:IPTL-CTERM sorting domain-containing protein [Acidovorax sp. M2(2025)]|uniref:IPTL-CTERM sorting domain-containing protein n=1 Tax=Acidovorax sp. M2(2025) TaxID=3411355 RepID=UPI003BF475E9